MALAFGGRHYGVGLGSADIGFTGEELERLSCNVHVHVCVHGDAYEIDSLYLYSARGWGTLHRQTLQSRLLHRPC